MKTLSLEERMAMPADKWGKRRKYATDDVRYWVSVYHYNMRRKLPPYEGFAEAMVVAVKAFRAEKRRQAWEKAHPNAQPYKAYGPRKTKVEG